VKICSRLNDGHFLKVFRALLICGFGINCKLFKVEFLNKMCERCGV
jgi:ribosomal protein S27AE